MVLRGYGGDGAARRWVYARPRPGPCGCDDMARSWGETSFRRAWRGSFAGMLRGFQCPLMIRSLLLALALLGVPALHAQTAADSSAIRAAALDYIEGWYTGDPARMERALHPELAKRIVRTDANGRSSLGQQSALTLINGVRAGGGTRTPVERQRKDVTILDIYEGSASVKLMASDWVDYLHLARWNGRWVIVNVLWELYPQRG